MYKIFLGKPDGRTYAYMKHVEMKKPDVGLWIGFI
jgi:hypothetical protein